MVCQQAREKNKTKKNRQVGGLHIQKYQFVKI